MKKNMNHRGMGKVLVAFIVFGIFAIMAGMVYGIFFMPQNTQNAGGNQTTQTPGGAVINTVNPTITVNGFDAYQQGLAVVTSLKGLVVDPKNPTANTGFGTITSGSTTISPGSQLSLLVVNNTAYHNTIYPNAGYTVDPTTGIVTIQPLTASATLSPFSVYLNKNASVSENMYSTTGVVLTNNNGNSSQTHLGNGVTLNFKDEMTASSASSTQDMVCIIEITDGGNITSGASGVALTQNNAPAQFIGNSKPQWYTLNGTNSALWLFNVAPVANGVLNTFNIQVNPLTNKALVAGDFVIKNCYTKEFFLDTGSSATTSGKILYGITDSNGNAQYGNTYKYIATIA